MVNKSDALATAGAVMVRAGANGILLLVTQRELADGRDLFELVERRLVLAAIPIDAKISSSLGLFETCGFVNVDIDRTFF